MTLCPRGCGRPSRRVLVNTRPTPPLCRECRLRPYQPAVAAPLALPAAVRRDRDIARAVDLAYARAVRDQRRRRLAALAIPAEHSLISAADRTYAMAESLPRMLTPASPRQDDTRKEPTHG